METIKGESRRYLFINLTSKTSEPFTADEKDLRDYIGGKGLGLKFIYDRIGAKLAEVDPLGPENILGFMMGTFIGTNAPCSARFAGVTKSPLTGIMVSSSCGGPFGMACKTAGWDGVLVQGKAERPTVVTINEHGATFEDAGELWGMETGPAQEKLVTNPRQGALVIGPAGENQVLYAVIRSGNRYLGRGGCHLNAYPIGLEALFNYIPQYTTLSKVSWVAFMEDLFSATNSTQTCQFSIFGYLLEPPIAKYTPKPLLKLVMTLMPELAQLLLDWSGLSKLVSSITGRKMSMHQYLLSGRRTHVLERLMNVRCGITAKDDTLPARFLTEAETKHPVRSVVPLERMVRAYYRKKGYDANGIPTARLLKKLGIPT